MTEKPRLSKVLDVKEIVESDCNRFCIISGVGSGKNYFVENVLKGYGNILYISSRRAKVNEILVNELCSEKIDWDNHVNDVTVLTNFGVEQLVKNKKFENGIRNIVTHYDFIVVDEAHSLFTDAGYTDSSFHVHTLLEYVSKNYPQIKIILMTGTPEPLGNDYLNGYIIIDKMDECINVLPQKIEIITYKKAVNLLKSLPDGEKSIYYSNFAAGIVKGEKCLFKKLTEDVYTENEISICMGRDSIQKYKNELSGLEDKVKDLRAYIVEHNELPEESRILLTTSTLKEGINIEYEKKHKRKVIKRAFVESHLLSDIQQFVGRIRDGLEVLYVVEDAGQHEVTDEQLKYGRLLYHYGENAVIESANKYVDNFVRNYESEIYTEMGFDDKNLFVRETFYKYDYSLYSIGGDASKAVVNFVEQGNQYRWKYNSYIRFNNLAGHFNLYENRLIEQERVNQKLKGEKWDDELDSFAEKYGIEYDSRLIRKRRLAEELNQMLEEYVGVRIYDENEDDGVDERDSFRDIFREKLGLSSKSRDKKNQQDIRADWSSL